MRQWIRSALVQIMACRLLGAKPLSKPMLCNYQLDLQEQTSMKFESKIKLFHSRKCIWKCRLSKWQPFCPGGDELMASWLANQRILKFIICQPGSHIWGYSPGTLVLSHPDSKLHGANMGPTWVLLSPGGPHVGAMKLAIWAGYYTSFEDCKNVDIISRYPVFKWVAYIAVSQYCCRGISQIVVLIWTHIGWRFRKEKYPVISCQFCYWLTL